MSATIQWPEVLDIKRKQSDTKSESIIQTSILEIFLGFLKLHSTFWENVIICFPSQGDIRG